MKTVLKYNRVCGLLVLLLLGLLTSAQATDFYVRRPDHPSNPGVDDRNRLGTSEEAAWASIGYALSKIPATGRHTLNVSDGTFNESNYLIIPSGVSLKGAGIYNTIIRVNQYYDITSGFYRFECDKENQQGYEVYFSRPEKFAIQLLPGGGTAANYQVISDFTLTGTDTNWTVKRGHGGIYASDIQYVKLDHLQIGDFKFTGIWLPKASDVKISYCDLHNNAFGNFYRSFADVLYHVLNNAEIDHNSIREDGANGIGNYGITYLPLWYSSFTDGQPITYAPCGDPINQGAGAYSSTNVDIHHNSISVPDYGLWREGQAGAFAFEGFDSKVGNWLFHDNTVNGGISPILNGDLSIGPFRVYNNTFNLLSTVFPQKFACEANLANLEFDHNYVEGGFGLSQSANRTGQAEWVNQKIHHNVFYQPTPEYPGGEPLALLTYGSFPKGFKFFNNTIVDTQGWRRLVRNYESPVDDAEIKNNLFISTYFTSPQQIVGNGFNEFNNPVIDHNLFYNYASFGADVVNVSSSTPVSEIIKLTDPKPRPYFELSPNSPAIDKGADIAGITDDAQGYHPDLGACESMYFGSPRRAATQTEVVQTLFTVSPNPVENQTIQIRLGSLIPSAFQLTTMDGKSLPVKQTSPGNNTLELTPISALPTGVYLLTLPTRNGPATQRIILH